MQTDAYAIEAEVEATHWWFAGRRVLFANEIAKLGISPDARILDVGTSTGTNLRMLRDLGYRNVVGLDFSDEAIRYCASKGLGHVEKGDICGMPFGDNSFDLVLATDIIEHVEDDHRAVAEIHRVLKPGGHVLITVPTFRSLWGLQDDIAQHKRRYRIGPLRTLVEEPGLSLDRSYYFNFILFLPIWLARRILVAVKPKIRSEGQLNTKTLNAVFGWLFKADVGMAGALRPPFGVSALVVAGKDRGASP